MSEEKKGGSIKDTIDAVTGLVNAIPVYNDAIQPAAKEVGKSLLVVSKAINIALSPISALVWGFEKIEGFINKRLVEKLENVPEENIVTPDPAIVGPSLEALRFLGNNEHLREMYANLIANSMDSTTASQAHPGFVEIIKNMDSDEAKILSQIRPNATIPVINIKKKQMLDKIGSVMLFEHLAILDSFDTVQKQRLIPSSLDNLQRLGLIKIDYDKSLVDEGQYDVLFETHLYKAYSDAIIESNQFVDSDKGIIGLTALGVKFRSICILEKKEAQ